MPEPIRPLAQLYGLTGRTAVITGSGQGFGAAIARRLAQAGAAVIVADLDLERASGTADRIVRETGAQVHPMQVNVADEESVHELFRQVADLGMLADILVNNAGVFSNYTVTQLPAAEFSRIMTVNVAGAFMCAQAFARNLQQARRTGCVVNIASVDAIRPSAPGLLHYTTSKHAIAGLTRSMAMELASTGIRVNAVCPGASRTEGVVAFIQAGAPEGISLTEQWSGIVDRTPLRRLCDPDDVARAVTFLASDMAEFITGVLLPVDGGILVQPLEGFVDLEVTA